MAALFREFLIFELNAGGARGGVTANRAIDIQQPAVAGVAVGEKWKARRAGDAAHAVEHFGKGSGAGVGHTKRRGDDAIAGHIKRIKAGARRHSRRDAVIHAWKGQAAIPLQQCTKRRSSRQAVLLSFPGGSSQGLPAINSFKTGDFGAKSRLSARPGFVNPPSPE